MRVSEDGSTYWSGSFRSRELELGGVRMKNRGTFGEDLFLARLEVPVCGDG